MLIMRKVKFNHVYKCVHYVRMIEYSSVVRRNAKESGHV